MLWQKDNAPDEWLTRFTVGNDYQWDTLLLPYDVEGTRIHAWGLKEAEILTPDEYASVADCLDGLKQEAAAGTIEVTAANEDCHTVIEMYVTRHLGETGEKIHAGRSRNDQVLVALRMFLRERLRAIASRTMEAAEALCTLGEKHARDLMPGYTHMQRAMPTTAGLWALGYAEMLTMDLTDIQQAHQQINSYPAGSAAGYGVPHLSLPREEMAKRLGFSTLQIHAPAVQLSRGKLELNAVHAVGQLGATLNRLASDLVLFNTSEFDYVELPEELCTGSSIMPQKKNPDVLELIRAKYHRLLAEMQLLMTLPANHTSGYHRDLQLTKEAAMRCMLVGDDMVAAIAGCLPQLRFDVDRMKAGCSPELFATAETMRRVRDGVPFRAAYRQTARDLDTIEAAPTIDEALSAYHMDGSPGRGRPDLLRESIARHEDWAG